MTTLAMIFGMVPLAFAIEGAGAVAKEVSMSAFDPFTFPARTKPELKSDDDAKKWAEEIHRSGHTPAEDIMIDGQSAKIRIKNGRAEIER